MTQSKWEAEVSCEAKDIWERFVERAVKHKCTTFDFYTACDVDFPFSAQDIVFWKEKYLEQQGCIPIETVHLYVSIFKGNILGWYLLADFLRTTNTKNVFVYPEDNNTETRDLLNELRRLKSLEKLYVCEVVSANTLGSLIVPVQSNKGIRSLKFECNNLLENIKVQTLQMLHHLPALECLDIGRWNISDSDLWTLKHSIEISGSFKTLRKLTLFSKPNKKSVEACKALQALTELIIKCGSLEELKLFDTNWLGANGAAVQPDLDLQNRFFSAAKSQLSTLTLRAAGITREMLLSIVSGAKCGLKNIRLLSENVGFTFESPESRRLCRGLSSLKSIHLFYCTVHLGFITSMLGEPDSSLENIMVHGCDLLQRVEADSNKFQDFIASMESNKKIKNLQLVSCGMSGELVVPLFKSLPQNLRVFSITHHDLSVNCITKSQELRNLLWSNKSLTTLSVGTEFDECNQFISSAVVTRNNLQAKASAHSSQLNSKSWPMLLDHHFDGKWDRLGMSSTMQAFLVEWAQKFPCRPKIYKRDYDAVVAEMGNKIRRLQEECKQLRGLATASSGQ